MKTCSCGKLYARVPIGAIASLESIAPGYYFNCPCKSTLFFPMGKYAPPGALTLRNKLGLCAGIIFIFLIAIYFIN